MLSKHFLAFILVLSIFLSYFIVSFANNEFIFPNSSTKKLSESDVLSLRSDKLFIARNEIFARHGHIFENKYLKNYFSSKSWYKPVRKISFDELSSTEKYNVMLITYFEKYYYQNRIFGKNNNKNEKIQLFPANKLIYYDLDNNGKKESVIYKPSKEGFSLQINNEVVTNKFYTNLQDKFAIVDIDKSDKYKEIVIFDEGPSADYTSIFYQFYNNKIIELGTVGGIYNIGLHIYGNGTLEGLTRAKILQTWYFNEKYILKNHKLEIIPQDVYKTNYYVFVKRDIKLHTTKSEKISCFTLYKGQIVNIVGCDNNRWCLMETSTGKKGWLLVKDFSFLVDSKVQANDALTLLCYAD